MLMNLFILWSIVSLLVLVYAVIFRNTPLDTTSPAVPEPQSDVELTEIVPRKADRAGAAKKDTGRAA